MDDSLFTLLDRTLDPEYGIIRYIKELPLTPDEPDIFITITEFQDPFKVSPDGAQRTTFKMGKQAAGAALDRETSVWSAIGEAIERYAAAIYDPEDLSWAASKDLEDDNFVSPNDFILFSKEQYEVPNFKYHKHDPEATIAWTKARQLDNDKEINFPASLAYFAYEHKHKSEYLSDSYSTGLACGPTKEWAICSGLYEAIERDAYSLHWAASQPAKKIDLQQAIDCADPDLKKLLKHQGVDIFIGDITNDLGIPTILVITKHKDKPGLALGAASNLCIKTALKKAVVESFHTFNWCIDMHRWEKTIKKEKIKDFSEHVQYYIEKDHEKFAEFFWKSSKRSTLLDGLTSTSPTNVMNHKEQISILLDKLKDHQQPAYVIDITPADIASLGLHVTKVLVPGLQPMWCGYGRVPKDRRRFEKFLKYLKKDKKMLINEEIHPFP